MSRSTTHRSSDVAWDGKKLSEYSGGGVSVNGTLQLRRWVAPCDGTIVSIGLNVGTTPTNAAAALQIGTLADPDSHLDDYDLTDHATGFVELIANALTLETEVTKGTVYVIGFVNADTTGEIDVSVIVEPRGPA